MTKEFLSERGIEFETRDALVDPTAKAELQELIGASTNEELLALGYITPITLIGEQMIVGYKIPELAEALGLPGPEAMQFDPQWMFGKVEVLLPALVRGARQIPDDQLDWVAPYEKTTIRKLMSHMLVRLMMCPDAEATGKQSAEGSSGNPDDVSFPTSESMALYAEKVLDRMRWWLGEGNCHLEMEVDTFKDGHTTVGHMLGLVMGHLVHHVRQLYLYMDMMGIPPEDPVGEEEFDGILYPAEI